MGCHCGSTARASSIDGSTAGMEWNFIKLLFVCSHQRTSDTHAYSGYGYSRALNSLIQNGNGEVHLHSSTPPRLVLAYLVMQHTIVNAKALLPNGRLVELARLNYLTHCTLFKITTGAQTKTKQKRQTQNNNKHKTTQTAQSCA
jgi:hypothetical protein